MGMGRIIRYWVCEPHSPAKWRAQGDYLRTFLSDFVVSLPQVESRHEWSQLRDGERADVVIESS
jgi:hypothetical protein